MSSSSSNNQLERFRIPLKQIADATNDFSSVNLIRRGGFGEEYKGQLLLSGQLINLVARRLDRQCGHGNKEFWMEVLMLSTLKHENLVSIIGFCDENEEKIVINKHDANGSLDQYLRDPATLTWTRRLEICVGMARALSYIHYDKRRNFSVVHRNIKSSKILLDDNWKPKLSGFELSMKTTATRRHRLLLGGLCGTRGYIDPIYEKTGGVTHKSDVYSLGVVLFEVMCGRTAFINPKGFSAQLAKHGLEEESMDMVGKTLHQGLFDLVKKMDDGSSPTPANPTMGLLDVVENLDEWFLPQLANQVSTERSTYELSVSPLQWSLVSNLPELMEAPSISDFRDQVHSNTYMFSEPGDGEAPGSDLELLAPFHKVAELLDISNLNIQIKIKAQFLSLGVNYGVRLVFRFYGPRKSVDKRMYVNLKYKKGSESLHAYFATWREDGWMMTELCRFFNHNRDVEFEFLLESFSQCYCESRGVYVEGIEFRAIDNVEHEEIKESKDVQQPLIKLDLNTDQVQQLPTNCENEVQRFESYDEGEKAFSPNKVSKKKHFILSAKEALFLSSDVKLFKSMRSTHSRSEDMVELIRQQVFHIKCKIESQMLSPDTEYTCYLVFKLSEKCHGLHCPVIVRNLLNRKIKEKGIIYFRSPSPCNVNDTDRVPKEREDGWMEVNVWKFNSSNEIRDDCVSINLKLICYEGTMSGLSISSIGVRSM
ncbi:hypothetical protein Lser_V15G01733 [Lactuca serriola]